MDETNSKLQQEFNLGQNLGYHVNKLGTLARTASDWSRTNGSQRESMSH